MQRRGRLLAVRAAGHAAIVQMKGAVVSASLLGQAVGAGERLCWGVAYAHSLLWMSVLSPAADRLMGTMSATCSQRTILTRHWRVLLCVCSSGVLMV